MKLSSMHAVAAAALVGIAGGVLSDIFGLSFWNEHAMLTSLLASMLVALFTVVAVGEALALRDRRRWALLAQNVLFALMQSARATWTGILSLLELIDVDPQDEDSRARGLAIAGNSELLGAATTAMLGDPERRARLQHMTHAFTDHGGEVIARWAPVMVSAAPYAEVLNRHTELLSRLEWLASTLQHNEPARELGIHATHMARSSIAAERQIDDTGVRDLLVAITAVAAELDEDSRRRAFDIVPSDWWLQRTAGLASSSVP